MAEAVLAEMRVGRGLTKLVVLKRMWPDLAADSDFVALFMREARLSARMSHPNVVQTYEVLDDANRPTIAMEYLDGQPLTAILTRLQGSSSLGLTSRLRIITGVLAALEYAHELTDYAGTPNGVVHRDVNPQNVFVTYTGQVKLLDFGVAKSMAAAYQTRPGSVKGKIGYMAPEQVVGGAVDRRVDLFAVGIMLWEMVAGRRMWRGMTDGEIVRHLAGRFAMPPLPESLSVPHGLGAICARAIAARPENRYASASELAADLERLLAGSDDAHRRHLGRVVSLAFERERVKRRSLIDAHMNRHQALPISVPVSVATATAASLIDPVAAPAFFEDTSSEVTLAVEESAIVSVRGDANAAERAERAERQLRQTARVNFGRPKGSQWRVMGLAAAGLLAFGASLSVARLSSNRGRQLGRIASAAVKAVAPGAAQASPTIRAPAQIVIAPMRDGVTEQPVPVPAALSCNATASVVAAPVQSSSAPTSSRPMKAVRLAVRDDQDSPRRQPSVKQQVREHFERERERRGSGDDILQPTVDLSETPLAGDDVTDTTTLVSSPVVAPASPRLARRSTPRPLDEADPFWQ